MRKIAGVLIFLTLLQFVLFASKPGLKEAVTAFSSTGNVYQAYLFFQDYAPVTLADDDFQMLLSFICNPGFEKPGILTKVLKNRVESVLAANSKTRIEFILHVALEAEKPVLKKEIAIILGKIPAGKPKKKYLNNYEFVWEDEIYRDEKVILLLQSLRNFPDEAVRKEAESALNRILKTSVDTR